MAPSPTSCSGRLIHGEGEWATITVPKTLARVGARLEELSEPVVPDALDQGEKPFMVDMADDHYALDISRARDLLGWQPARRVGATLPSIIQALKDDLMPGTGRTASRRRPGSRPRPWRSTTPRRCASRRSSGIATSTGAISGRISAISAWVPG